MIPFDDALGLVREIARPLGVVHRRLTETASCVLAEDIIAPYPSPLFDNSSMDGFAVRADDLRAASRTAPVALTVDGEMRAGDAEGPRVRRGKAVRIMTGARIPRGCDAVVQKEHVQENDGTIRCTRPVAPGNHIRRRGSEFRAGETVLAKGTPVTPAVAGLLGSIGQTRVPVFRHPRVSVVITGSELTRAAGTPGEGKIRDANSWSLSAALRQLGIEPRVHFVGDRRDQLLALLRSELRECDLLLTTGGISVGEYDFVRDALRVLRVREHFWRVAMKPGKPVLFGSRGRRLVFALPGNPVSALLTAVLLVRPALLRVLGVADAAPSGIAARLGKSVTGDAERTEFLRVSLLPGPSGVPIAEPVAGQESFMLTGMTRADGILRLPPGSRPLREGSLVMVHPLTWGLS